MKLANLTLIALFSTMLAAPALAQPGPGMGGGMGPGGGGRFAIDNKNTVGWALMTQEEHNAHRQKMWSFKNYDECKAYQQEHHQTMEARAKERGKTLVPPRANACDRMKARGVIQ
ncbi:MAG: hypothetical protein Q8L56_06310 [Rhodocyclaceae bacterium]|nr:hypothetical protein [Rhodocyclaceae bacterium]